MLFFPAEPASGKETGSHKQYRQQAVDGISHAYFASAIQDKCGDCHGGLVEEYKLPDPGRFQRAQGKEDEHSGKDEEPNQPPGFHLDGDQTGHLYSRNP
jgi:hypothetical protein